ncbi:MAG: hypothetical protein KF836_04810 [Fimbriimonadaceae bacterium]|nr:hypothetical protein [Fimbriimonadaceae bacterium]
MFFAFLSAYALVPWEIKKVFFEPYQELRYYDEVRYAGGTWRAETLDDFSEYGVPNHYARLLFNGQEVFTNFPEQHLERGDGFYNDAGFIHSPDSKIFFVHREHSGMGHGESTTFYSLHADGRIIKIHRESIEGNGPIFRDFDGDGKLEWVFDDSDYYFYYGKTPKWLLVYKPSPSGKLKLWKKIPNKHKVWIDRLQAPSEQKERIRPVKGLQKFKFE